MVDNRKTPKSEQSSLTSNELIFDGYIRHQTYLLRVAGGFRNEANSALEETEAAIDLLVYAYARDMEDISQFSKKGRELTSEFEKAVIAARAKAWDPIVDGSLTKMEELAHSEVLAAASFIETSLPVVVNMQIVPKSLTNRIVNSQPFEGKTLREWLRYNQFIDHERITRTAKDGVRLGVTPTEIARSVTGTKQNGRRDGQLRKAFRDNESVYLTTTNGIANQARSELYKENADIISEELFVATLDGGTTLICAGNDQKRFPLGQGPIPPLHFRCRSLRTPYLNANTLSLRPYKASTEKTLLREFAQENDLGTITSRDDLPRGYKTSYDKWSRNEVKKQIGQVPAETSFNKWFATQSTTFQRDYLGNDKYEIYKKYDLNIDQFTNNVGNELTVADLERKGFSI